MNIPERLLIAAMRGVAGSRSLSAARWVALAHQHERLRDSLKAVFRRTRLPTPQKLGLWLSEHVGTCDGEFTLYGQHSSHGKAWRYVVLTAPEAEAMELKAAQATSARADRRKEKYEAAEQRELARAAKRRVATIERIEKLRRSVPRTEIKVAAAPPAAVPALPPGVPGRDFIVKVDSAGKVTRERITGRDGAPITADPRNAPRKDSITETDPETVAQVNVTERTASDPRLPRWVREGRQPTKAELTAQHTVASGGVVRDVWVKGIGYEWMTTYPVASFSDPGGVVTQAMNVGRATVHVCRPLSGKWGES